MKIHKILVTYCYLSAILILPASSVKSQPFNTAKNEDINFTAAIQTCIGDHNIGRLHISLYNNGKLGTGLDLRKMFDCFTGSPIMMGEYPRGSGNRHFNQGYLWLGGIVRGDTLFSDSFYPIEPMVKRSTINPYSPEYEGSVSELEYVSVFADNVLGVDVTLISYSWSYPHTDDFIILEYTIKNPGGQAINDFYVGLYMDFDILKGGIAGQVYNPGRPGDSQDDGKNDPRVQDDMGGFIEYDYDYNSYCFRYDSLFLAWVIDVFGSYDSRTGKFQLQNTIGTGLINSPKSFQEVSYNWWRTNSNPTYDIGPQKRENFRFMGNGTGWPVGDIHKYAVLSNGEIDYDPIYAAAIQSVDPVWVKPAESVARGITKGFDVEYLLSIGPWDLPPGAEITVPFVVVAGEGVHTNQNNHWYNLSTNYRPYQYMQNLNFTDFKRNFRTAKKVYDLPGRDTDGDGFYGKFEECFGETIYYEGDGVPDYAPSSPPKIPRVWLMPVENGILVRFNGYESETVPDFFTGEYDFEGYNIYIARDDREESFTLLTTYDRENYDKYIYMANIEGKARYQVLERPFTYDQLRCLYGKKPEPCSDSTFDIYLYDYSRPYVIPSIYPNRPDSLFYFKPHFYNRSEFGQTTKITKKYPYEPKPESIENLPPEQLTEDGYPKYYEYEFLITDLLPSVPYHISVTTFDQGSPENDMEPMESSIMLAAQRIYPNSLLDFKPDAVENVYVFPNPYRQDANYRIYGFEGLGQEDRMRDRVRKVTFANLPPKCTIRILSIDGDLIKELEHDIDPSDPNSSYHEWDLISRNVQRVCSGIYYWVVEDEKGNSQIGKLVILL
ncbi:MAG: hypothetical protein ABIJ12_13375 [bacterium]